MAEIKKVSPFGKFLNGVEIVGNKLPHPTSIFVLLAIIIIFLSAILQSAGVSVTYTGIDRSTLEVKELTVNARSLMNADGVVYMLTNAVKNFTGFAPLGVVLVAMLGVGVAEGAGLISALIKKTMLGAPRTLLTAVVVFVGVMSNIASDAGYVVLVPLGGIIFLAVGRHPLAGIAAAFAGVSGGYSANLLVGTLDPLLAGISTEAAKFIDPAYEVAILGNYFFMLVSTVLITAVGTLVTNKIVEPRLGEYKGPRDIDDEHTQISDEEKRGLKWALYSFIGLIVITFALVGYPGAPLLGQNPEMSYMDNFIRSHFIRGIVVVIMFYFMVPGIAFGIGAGKIKSDSDVIKYMGEAMGTMKGYLVLSFFAAQFINYFNYTNLGTILAVSGANFLKSVGFTGIVMVISFVIVSGFVNLFIGSASAKWAIMAPVFIPMLMQLGYTPEFIQLSYRIGDSTTNIITPLMSYFAVIVAFAQKYDYPGQKQPTGIGTLTAMMLPFSLLFLISWSLLMVIWFFLGLPIGPGVGIFLPS